jgi:hypothetical protein
MAAIKICGMTCVTAIFAVSLCAAVGEDASIVKAWELFNQRETAGSLAICEKLLELYPDDPKRTPETLLLLSLNYDHISNKSRKKDDQLRAKAAAERIINDYPTSEQTAEAYFYFGEFYSGNIPVKIETDCGKVLAPLRFSPVIAGQ